MPNLTQKELTAIQDQLQAEKILIDKLRAYSELSQDQTIKNTCAGWADKHQQHYDKLIKLLG